MTRIERVRVYKPSGRVTHLLRLADSPSEPGAETLCSMTNGAFSGDTWWGTGSQEEIDVAAKRPLCKICREEAE